MIISDLPNGDKVVVDSNWDSGIHKSFCVYVQTPDRYDGKTLDKILDKNEIEMIEAKVKND